MTSAPVENKLPPGLVSNLQDVLLRRKGSEQRDQSEDAGESADLSSTYVSEPTEEASDSLKPIVLVTNGDGIEAPGLKFLVDALVSQGLYNIHVCAPQSDKSFSGHSVTVGETVGVSSAEINGATAYEVSGTPGDCVSLALSGALFSWTKPVLVISGINRGSSYGHHMLYSGVVAGAREALICGVPSISISLNWKKDESQESDFKDAVGVCLPLINAAIRDIEKGNFLKSCFLNVEIPTSPLSNKGFKITKQSMSRSTLKWQAISTNRYPAGHFMSNQQSLGLQLAQLGRDASAAGAARRLTTQKKNVEIESTGASRKSDFERVKKNFRLEFVDTRHDDTNDELEFRALESGYVAITPISLSSDIEFDIHTAAADWISTALNGEQ